MELESIIPDLERVTVNNFYSQHNQENYICSTLALTDPFTKSLINRNWDMVDIYMAIPFIITAYVVLRRCLRNNRKK